MAPLLRDRIELVEQDSKLRFINILIIVVACAMAAYHLVSTQYLIWGAFQHQATHLAFALTLVFLSTLKHTKRRSLWPLLILLIISGITVCLYVLVRIEHLEISVGFIREPVDWLMGIILTIVVLEATRQTWGWILPLLTIAFILYFFYGHLLPPPLQHSTYKASYVLSMLGIGLNGVFGFLGISADFIFLFIIFGGMIATIGVQGFFLQVGRMLGKVLAGGAGQTAVFSSALVGMTMGAAVANVALTGSFTIPLMKKMGYTPEQAGAIEATASSGGQMTPPVMGSVAFLMANFLGIAYIDVCLAAFIPASLFYLSVALGVQVMAYKNKIPRPSEKIDMHEIILRGPLFIIPLGVIFTLLILRFTPMYAAFYATISALVVPLFRKETRISFKTYVTGFTNGALIGAKIAVAIAMIGMLIQTVITTGLGITIANIVETVSGGQLWLALVITMLLSLFLGIGMPSLAAYVIVAVIVVPALVRMGVLPIAAHFFAFWYAIFSTVTPPVAFGSMASSAMAGGNFMKTSLEGFRLAIAGFVLPYVMIFSPVLLLRPESPLEGTVAIIAVSLALAAIVVVLYGHFFVKTHLRERLFWVLSTAGLLGYTITHNYIMFIFGLLIFVPLAVWQWRRGKSGNLPEIVN